MVPGSCRIPKNQGTAEASSRPRRISIICPYRIMMGRAGSPRSRSSPSSSCSIMVASPKSPGVRGADGERHHLELGGELGGRVRADSLEIPQDEKRLQPARVESGGVGGLAHHAPSAAIDRRSWRFQHVHQIEAALPFNALDFGLFPEGNIQHPLDFFAPLQERVQRVVVRLESVLCPKDKVGAIGGTAGPGRAGAACARMPRTGRCTGSEPSRLRSAASGERRLMRYGGGSPRPRQRGLPARNSAGRCCFRRPC